MDKFLTPENLEKYGIGTLAILLILWAVYYYITKLQPKFDAITHSNEKIERSICDHSIECKNSNNSSQKMMETLNATIKNNTDAIAEVSRANDNVASAIRLLDSTLHRVEEKVDKIDPIYMEIIKIDERTKSCGKNSYKGD